MGDHMTQTLSELRTAIAADGVVDAAEAAKLRERLYIDGKIDQEEANFLFDLNDTVSGNANDPAWEALFVDGICDCVLHDESSPGVVDGDEAAWLVERIERDAQLDDLEKALLAELRNRATSIDAQVQALISAN